LSLSVILLTAWQRHRTVFTTLPVLSVCYYGGDNCDVLCSGVVGCMISVVVKHIYGLWYLWCMVNDMAHVYDLVWCLLWYCGYGIV
jgi:hypothetical protein